MKKQPTQTERTIAQQIKSLESGYCKPRKFKEAEELRADLRRQGYSDSDINRLTE